MSDVIPSRTTPYVTIAIIVLNTLAFLFEWQLTDRQLEQFLLQYGAVPAYLSLPSIVSSMFLHGGWLHFGGNMLYLWIFGDNVEDRFGHGRFLAFYLFCGAMAVFGQVATNPYSLVPMIGASGAIAGVMGAYFVLYPHSRVLTAVFILFFIDLVEIPAIFFLGIWFLMQLFSGVGSIGAASSGGGVAFWAHIFGFLTGLAFGLFGRWRDTARAAILVGTVFTRKRLTGRMGGKREEHRMPQERFRAAREQSRSGSWHFVLLPLSSHPPSSL